MTLCQRESKPNAGAQVPVDGHRITFAERAFLWQMLSSNEGPDAIDAAVKQAQQPQFLAQGHLS